MMKIGSTTMRVLIDGSIGWFAFLQGGWEDDEDVYEAACREALEEAGVRGTINVTTLLSHTIPSFAWYIIFDFMKAALARCKFNGN
jgi:8-oxo-dGTP pyrophosphatase MutT (NUDIX family)